MSEELPESIQCIQTGCVKRMWLKPEGKFGPFYSHKVAEGEYHNANVDEVRLNGNWRATQQQETRERVEQPDWDAIARGKVRCQVFCAVVQRDGLAAALEALPAIENGVEYVMTGLDEKER